MKRSLLFSLILFITIVSGFAQKQTIRGQVKDSFIGETIVGANVLIKGTQVGAVTDIDGKFSMQLEKGKYTLEVSYVGYEPSSQEIEAFSNIASQVSSSVMPSYSLMSMGSGS